MDLTLFQFDYDLTMSVFFMNADKTIYGRYGNREDAKDKDEEMTVAGLARSMEGALLLHRQYPQNKAFLAGKQPKMTRYRTPQDYPLLRGKFKETLDFEGAITKNCVHCHQLRDGARDVYRKKGEAIPEALLFPNPEPALLGIEMDPRTRATIGKVADGSAGENSGFQAGDEILTLDEQAILSQADVQWALHHAENGARLPALVKRKTELVRLQLMLPKQWRGNGDISWRGSTWPLRRMVSGGIVFEAATEQQRRAAGVSDGNLALVTRYVGQYGPHGVGKRAGVRKGDILVSFDGVTRSLSPSQLIAYALENTRVGEEVPVAIMRGGKRLEMKLLMQH